MLLNACMSEVPGARLNPLLLEWPMAVLKPGVSLLDWLLTLGLSLQRNVGAQLTVYPRVARCAPHCIAPHESACAKASY